MSAPLPAWASTKTARALLLAIVEERPATRIASTSSYWTSADRVEEYCGRNAAALRKIYDAAFDAALVDSPPYGTPAYQAFRNEWIATENADQLIERILREAQGIVDCGEGRFQVAA